MEIKEVNQEAIYDYFNQASIRSQNRVTSVLELKKMWTDAILVNRIIIWQVTHVTFRRRCSQKSCSDNFGSQENIKQKNSKQSQENTRRGVHFLVKVQAKLSEQLVLKIPLDDWS